MDSIEHCLRKLARTYPDNDTFTQMAHLIKRSSRRQYLFVNDIIKDRERTKALVAAAQKALTPMELARFKTYLIDLYTAHDTPLTLFEVAMRL